MSLSLLHVGFYELCYSENKDTVFLLIYLPATSRNFTHGFSSVWAGFPERSRDGNKFVMAEKPVKQARRNFCSENADSIIKERQSRRESASNGFFDENADENSSSNLLDALFDDVNT